MDPIVEVIFRTPVLNRRVTLELFHMKLARLLTLKPEGIEIRLPWLLALDVSWVVPPAAQK